MGNQNFEYNFPSFELLRKSVENLDVNQAEIQSNIERIIRVLKECNVEVESIETISGPTVTTYQIIPKACVDINDIMFLSNEIRLGFGVIGVRVIDPLPKHNAFSIEIPNKKPQQVSIRSVLDSAQFEKTTMKLPIVLGLTTTNDIFLLDLAQAHHILIGGAVGQGKTICLNSIITSLLFKKRPDELKFVMVDAKCIEFGIYKQLFNQYMAVLPGQDREDVIIRDSKKFISALTSMIKEMENRYVLFADAKCQDVEQYNDMFVSGQLDTNKVITNELTQNMLHHKKLPQLVLVVDEFSDFMIWEGKKVESLIQTLLRRASKAGIHLILATARVEYKIVTGSIKALMLNRIAFRASSVLESHTLLDTRGADCLIGHGDMLYSGAGEVKRIQCPFIENSDIANIVKHICEQSNIPELYLLP